MLGQSRAPAAERQAEAAQPQVTEVVWSRLEALLPVGKRVGRPYGHDRRVILNALIYLMQTDCGWQHLPSDFPPWQTVYAQLTQWRTTGIWDTIWSGLDIPRPTEELQL